MKIYITLKTMLSFFIIMTVIFLAVGCYSLDSSLISIGCLFAVAGFILQLEMKDLSIDPFA